MEKKRILDEKSQEATDFLADAYLSKVSHPKIMG